LRSRLSKGPIPLPTLATLWPLLLMALLSVSAILPLVRTQPLCTHDGSLHYYRLVAIRDAIESGIPFTRWLPSLAFGYGYPFFNYREPVGYYLAEAVYLLGLGAPAALNTTYIICLLTAGWGAYLLARDLWGSSLAGIVVGLVYLYAPYQLIDALYRGNLPESVALALLPWILWLFLRYLRAPRPRTFVLAALGVSVLFLTHNISSLLFVPFLGIALLFLAHAERAAVVTLIRALVALALGALAAAFYWVPALLEQDLVTLFMSHTTRNNDFHFNFLGLAEILDPLRRSDPSLLNPPLTIPLGLPLAALAVAGLVFVLLPASASTDRPHTRRSRRLLGIFLALSAVGMVVMATPASLALWERLPLIAFVQFPWRLIGRAVLPAALLAGGAVLWVPPRGRAVFAGLAAAVVIITAIPWLYPAVCQADPYPDLGDIYDFERRSGLVGVDPEGSYFPRWVGRRPDGSPLEAALRAGDTPRRFDTGVLPAGARLLSEFYGANTATIELESPAPFRAVYHTFYFPGWIVRIDGQSVPIGPTEKTGLLSFGVPAGLHTIEVHWGLTPTRATAAAISAAAALVLVLALIIRPAGRLLAGSAYGAPGTSAPFPRRAALVLLALAVAVPAAKVLAVDRGLTPLRQVHLSGDSRPGLDFPLRLSLADGLELLGYSVQTAPAGSEFRIDLAWTSRQAPAGDYASHVALIDEYGVRWTAKEIYRPRGYEPHPSTQAWRPGTWVLDSHSVPILPGTPPGDYQIELTVFDRATLAPLNVLDPAGGVAGPSAIIGSLDVDRPAQVLTGIDPQRMLDQSWGSLTLFGVHLDRAEAAPGDPMMVTLYWRAEGPLPDLSAVLELIDPAGAGARSWTVPLVHANYPPSAWRVGDELTGQHALQIPGRVGDGTHTWQLTVVDAAGRRVGEPTALGSIAITAPERLWAPPAVGEPTDIAFFLPSGAPFARLVGYDAAPEVGRLDLTLVWEALGETEGAYRTYVHLLDPAGRRIAQSDAVPAGWTRPTAGWAPGEFIVDRHTIPLPDAPSPGAYTLAVGLYDPATGDRLSASADARLEVTLP
jgi:hypothetical protein